ncbi:FG-GAP repeat protein [Planctomycetes bacterium Pla163]|uniref:FG-GAP repeat protein n=1 Tax=Rohdeia mirabilis TaxID=2528008 RepID=A0A518D0C5_9BACT|nr:FG-GAP repeat protein [Planctomycetes bacterium Pla163]
MFDRSFRLAIRPAFVAGPLALGLCVAPASAQSIVHQINGPNNARYGQSVDLLGDLDGDGRSEIMVGAWLDVNNGLNGSGTVHVLRGVDASSLYEINGSGTGDHMGFGSSRAGDVNGDGVPDICAAADEDDVPGPGNNAGSARLVSGIDGSTIRELSGQSANDLFGWYTAPCGDVNGDGFDDVAVGSLSDTTGATGNGSVRVYSGIDGAELHVFRAPAGVSNFGSVLGYLGDANADGFDDVLVSSPSERAVYVYSGIDGSQLHRIASPSTQDLFGAGVDGGIDVDDDGHADILVGAPGDDQQSSNSGAVYVFSGDTGAQITKITLAGAGKRLGTKVRGGGDVDGDGYIDFVASATLADNGLNNSGRVYAFSGKNLQLIRGVGGPAANWQIGNQLGGGFDVDGDGLADAVAGAVNVDAAVVVSFRPIGVTLFGNGTVACGGRTLLSTRSVPRVGASGFGLIGSGVAPGSPVYLALSGGALASPVPLAGGDLAAHIDLGLLVGTYFTVADGKGSFDLSFPIPSDPGLAGALAYFQGIGAAPAGCGQVFVTTNGLELDVQP